MAGVSVGDNFRLDGGGPGSPTRCGYRLAPPCLHLRVGRDGIGTLRNRDGVVRRFTNPSEALGYVERSVAGLAGLAVAGESRFAGGWVGYFSYDLGRFFEELPATAADDLPFGLIELTYHHAGVAVDLVGGVEAGFESPLPEGAAGPIAFGAHAGAEVAGIEAVGAESVRVEAVAVEPLVASPPALRSNFSREAYCDAVARAVEYIQAGDIFQVNLAQRLEAGMPCSAANLYSRLREGDPGWYSALLDFGDYAIVSNSPELFLRVDSDETGKRRVTTRPIKGTRPRRPGMDTALLQSEKDQAELNMIVDLERNDLGRVCTIGSVKVTQPRTIEAHAGVYHGVATVEGELRDDVSLVDLLAATFPGGSITGAPKIRSMQIIEELEGVRRGPYCGAIGYIGGGGHLQLNIAIRTVLAVGGTAYVSVGGGIVADSQPADEYAETLTKAARLLEALGVDGGNTGR